MAVTTKDADGGDGDPKNVIDPLPANVRDSSDPTGATAVDPGVGGKPGAGILCASGLFVFTLDAIADAPDGMLYSGNGPEDGKKYVVATITVRNASPAPQPHFD